MGKECGAWVSRRLWGGGNTSLLKTTAWEATSTHNSSIYKSFLLYVLTLVKLHVMAQGKYYRNKSG